MVAITGLILAGYVVLHALGNLNALQGNRGSGEASIDCCAEWLPSVRGGLSQRRRNALHRGQGHALLNLLPQGSRSTSTGSIKVIGELNPITGRRWSTSCARGAGGWRHSRAQRSRGGE